MDPAHLSALRQLTEGLLLAGSCLSANRVFNDCFPKQENSVV
jgi:hypothetical protein